MLPYLLLGYNTVRGFHDGIRENVLLGRALGMTREQLLDAICQGVLHARRRVVGQSSIKPPETCWRTWNELSYRGRHRRHLH